MSATGSGDLGLLGLPPGEWGLGPSFRRLRVQALKGRSAQTFALMFPFWNFPTIHKSRNDRR